MWALCWAEDNQACVQTLYESYQSPATLSLLCMSGHHASMVCSIVIESVQPYAA